MRISFRTASLSAILAFGAAARAQGQEALSAPSASDLPPAKPLDLSLWHWGGAFSLNYRNIGAKPIEIEVENQVQINDIFVAVEGPVMQGTPFLMEFALNTSGQPELYRLSVKTFQVRRFEFELGRFLVPFGHQNELYRPDQYPLVTKSLLYASPGLDFVSRVSHPHPLFSSGYTDTGLRVTYKPPATPAWIPHDVTFFLVNGLQESPIHGRRPPDSRTFLILDSVSGTDLDFGHEVNFLSDNNDTKNPGGRLGWDYGDIRYPSPFSRAAVIKGFSAGVSGMIGKYDIEDRLSNWVWNADLGLRHREFRLTGEFMQGETQEKSPLIGTAGDDPPTLVKDRYRTTGYSAQLEFPFPEFWLSQQTRLAFRAEMMRRDGPPLNVLGEVEAEGGHRKTHMKKLSGGFNSRMNPYFSLKAEYAAWVFDSFPDIWQIAWSGVVTF